METRKKLKEMKMMEKMRKRSDFDGFNEQRRKRRSDIGGINEQSQRSCFKSKENKTEAEKNSNTKESIKNGRKDEIHSNEPKPEPLSSQAQQKQQQQNTTTIPSPTPSPSPQPKQYTSGRGAFGTIHFTRGKRMDGGWRGVGGRALIVYSQEMEMGRGAVGAPTTPLSPAVGGGGIGIGGGGATLGVMGIKDLNKEVTRAMQDEFQNEKGKVDDEEAKITFNSLESDDQREKLLCLMKLQETQKKKEKEEKERRLKKKEERELRKMEKTTKKIEEKDNNL
ncbi:uncharacterized protein MONOS_15970 [Monocercomonoides exilis]|uniref:uncharacterized protein n=1 Tax=Monocercomonoides exilis TaxID=2049356 RepID=UPI00355A4E58|nr:hypothetical protein MONOS_15970 [Monocercomonoides exilis]|eukprot:MONOS_15970.1-p1 / transcript=MONOS_15970.1 / gene=MONOS_15970 / organism=Monocercomonoides_exilis_PA203 / gene_product=unspecified product / transcript_product=unspecified product / location=Mono_scaffold01432:4939-5778(-) / protein_length=280 / sequence_SO=supercontig / SO=protein_coding / is_pseudo=false